MGNVLSGPSGARPSSPIDTSSIPDVLGSTDEKKQGKIVYAFDFDGVICGSAVELVESSIRASQTTFPDLFPKNFSADERKLLEKDVMRIRPRMKTGYELIMCSLVCAINIRSSMNGEKRPTLNGEELPTQAELIALWPGQREKLMKQLDSSFEVLNNALSYERDVWMEKDLDSWIRYNPCFPGVIDAINHSECDIYIISTKEKKYITKILEVNGVNPKKVPADHIFALGSGTKIQILKKLFKQYPPETTIHFVEDFYPMLEEASISLLGENVKYYLASWGYNTQEDRDRAEIHPFMTVIDLPTFVNRMQ